MVGVSVERAFDRADGSEEPDVSPQKRASLGSNNSNSDSTSSSSSASFPPVSALPGPRFTQHEINTFEALLRPLISNPRSSASSTTTNTNAISTTANNTTTYNNNTLSCVSKPNKLTNSRSVYGRPASLRSRDYILKDWSWNDGVCTCDLCRAPSSTCASCRKNAFAHSHQPKSVKGCDCNLCMNGNNHKKAIENNTNSDRLLNSHTNDFIPSFGISDRTHSSLLLLNNSSNSNGVESKNKSGSSSYSTSGSKLISDVLQTFKTESKTPGSVLSLLPPTPAPITSRLTRLVNDSISSQKALRGPNDVGMPLPSSSCSSSSSFSSPPSPSSSSSQTSTSIPPFSSFSNIPRKEEKEPSFTFGSSIPTQDKSATEKASLPFFQFPTPTTNAAVTPSFSPNTEDIFKAPTATTSGSFGDVGFSSLKNTTNFFPAPIPTPDISSSSSLAFPPSNSSTKGKRRKGGEDDEETSASSAKKFPSFNFGGGDSGSTTKTPQFNFDFNSTAPSFGAPSTTFGSSFSATPSFGMSTPATSTIPNFGDSQASSFANAFNPTSFGASAPDSTNAFSGSFSSSGFPSLSGPSHIGFTKGGKAVKARKYSSRNNLDAGMKLYEETEEPLAEFAEEDDAAE